MRTCANCGRQSEGDFRFCPYCAAPFDDGSQEQRKTVTVLFCDVTGSTAMGEAIDPERLRVVLARYFERMKAIVEHHGGTVEKFIGDAVMAVFGVPVLHEDDALRAARAAVEMRDALPELGIAGRIGVMTGEVVTGTQERLATGDAVNVAARLEQAAQPGEVLIGEPTLALLREAAEVEAAAFLTLKGKAEPVPAYRLLDVRAAVERRHESPFVGRELELAALRDAWHRAVGEPCCELVTVVGDAGVGKSRLAAELLGSTDATVLLGRCLPYGDGITYWPVVEVLKQLRSLPREESAAGAIRSLLGEAETGESPEEIAWAFRKTLEEAAAERPVAVLFDDIQWSEPPFRDLVEHVALLSSGAPILLLCLARPDLAERHPEWPVTLQLAPLADAEVAELIGTRASAELGERVARAAGGNPLFVEEMLAMGDEASSRIVVPPSLQALLTARVDQLEAAERGVLECAAVEGEIFHRGALLALSPDRAQVTPQLAALVRKGVIRPDRAQIPGDDGFRFRHILLRDAAYESLPKAVRADLHGRFAEWLAEAGSTLVEQDELVGYHLEQACRYRSELGLPRDAALAEAAKARLTAGGRRAAARQDYGAAASLFERAAALAAQTDFDVVLEQELLEALHWMGRRDDARRRGEAFAARAAAAGNRIAELCGLIEAALSGAHVAETVPLLVDEARPVFEAAGDDRALFVAYNAMVEASDWDEALEMLDRAEAHARRAGHVPGSHLSWHAAARCFGSTPARELLAWLDENEPPTGRDHLLRAYRANALSMLERFDEARALLAGTREELRERGAGILLANILSYESWWTEMLAGQPAVALEYATQGWELYDELGERAWMRLGAGRLAETYLALERLDEAEAWAARALQSEAEYPSERMGERQLRARILARHGEHEEATRLAREAVAMEGEIDDVNKQGDAWADLAEVLALVGKPAEAAQALEQAVERYERKGNVASASQGQARLEQLRGAAGA